jgi:hypothetical protein
MPGRPRKSVVQEDVVGLYHVWSRCVRRAWLCGVDPLTGQDLSHRKLWIYQRLAALAQIFAVDACVFAILSNHYHLLVRNRPDLASQWSDEEVVRRWWQLYPERRDDTGAPAAITELEVRSLASDSTRVAELRRRLSSISWFMKSMNEWLAVRANGEDGVSGHFFQERFGCRALLDALAVLACSVYIDLNEIRAQLAATPEESRNTSAHQRILARIARREREAAGEVAPGVLDCRADDADYWLSPLDEQDCAAVLGPSQADSVLQSRACDLGKVNKADVRKRWRHGFLPMKLDQYLELLEWTGRQIVKGKQGAIDGTLPPILQRLQLDPNTWLKLVDNFEGWFRTAAGTAAHLADEAQRTGRRWLHGLRAMRSAFG